MLAATPLAAQQTVGLFENEPGSHKGYTLFAPIESTDTFLVDEWGKLVNSWSSAHLPGASAYLLPNGNLLRTANFAAPGTVLLSGGAGGRLEEFTWEGQLVWSFTYSTTEVRAHHDVARLPNGNILMVAWERISRAEAIANGRNPALLNSGQLWPDHVIEVAPHISGGTIVWEWHAWDHLIQDFDPAKANYGVVADHPERIDVNFPGVEGDWMHINAIDYNPDLDQLMLCSPRLNELWIIDHSTTTAEAAGSTGGRWGKGGDLLYRWGNPQAYDRGTAADRTLFQQHNAHWIPAGLPGAGHILVFNNGVNRPGGSYSSIDELIPPVDEDGNYVIEPGEPYGPRELFWTYEASPPSSFYASFISGAERQPNGNTLICDGPKGRLFEVARDGDTVWDYLSPIGPKGPVLQGEKPAENAVFRTYRYAASSSALADKDLTSEDPLEQFDQPAAAPNGGGNTEPLTVELAPSGALRLRWDAESCPSTDYNLLYGMLGDVASYKLSGALCGLGADGSHGWNAPRGNLYFFLVGVDKTGIYESSWGKDSNGDERKGAACSGLCDTKVRVDSITCDSR